LLLKKERIVNTSNDLLTEMQSVSLIVEQYYYTQSENEGALCRGPPGLLILVESAHPEAAQRAPSFSDLRKKVVLPMNNNQTRRWIEIRFFYLMLHAKDLHNDMQDALNLISCLSPFGDYSVMKVQAIAMELVQANWMHPSRDEIVYLAEMNHLSRQRLLRVLHLHNQSYYDILKRKHLATGILPRLASDAHPEIEKFLKAYDTVGGFNL